MPLNNTITINTIATLIGIIIFIASLFGTYYDLKQDIALIKQDVNTIKTNELIHVQSTLNDIKTRNDLQDTRTIQLGNDIARLSALIEKYK
jgi:hypothetical protein